MKKEIFEFDLKKHFHIFSYINISKIRFFDFPKGIKGWNKWVVCSLISLFRISIKIKIKLEPYFYLKES
jgi:hypothetical protein